MSTPRGLPERLLRLAFSRGKVRSRRNRELTLMIRQLHLESNGVHGARKVHRELLRSGQSQAIVRFRALNGPSPRLNSNNSQERVILCVETARPDPPLTATGLHHCLGVDAFRRLQPAVSGPDGPSHYPCHFFHFVMDAANRTRVPPRSRMSCPCFQPCRPVAIRDPSRGIRSYTGDRRFRTESLSMS